MLGLLPGSAGLRGIGLIWDLRLALLIRTYWLRLLLLNGVTVLLLLFVSTVARVILGGQTLSRGPAVLLLPRVLAAVYRFFILMGFGGILFWVYTLANLITMAALKGTALQKLLNSYRWINPDAWEVHEAFWSISWLGGLVCETHKIVDLIRHETLVIGVEHPLVISFDLEHQKLHRHVLLEVDHQKLVGFLCGHFTWLRLEISAKDKASADRPHVRTAQVIHIPDPNSNGRRLLQEGILWHERDDSLHAVKGQKTTGREIEWLICRLAQ